jgi:hypothetical protein
MILYLIHALTMKEGGFVSEDTQKRIACLMMEIEGLI